jgi:hypothetical protein
MLAERVELHGVPGQLDGHERQGLRVDLLPGGGASAAASRAWSKAGSRMPAAGSTSTNRLPTPLLTAYQKRVPPSIHCGLTLSPMTNSPGRAGRRRSCSAAW